MKNFIRLIRIKHWLKNLLILLPAIFSKQFFDTDILLKILPAFFSFCLLSSAIYIFNDILDRDKDKKHPKKKGRPIASGKISVKCAVLIALLLLSFAAALNVLTFSYKAWIAWGIYFIVNIGYTLGLKNAPIVDVFLLVSGFFIRVIYGAWVTEIPISNWMYLTIMMLSFYLALGKRRGELKYVSDTSTRPVLEYYNYAFLDKFMYLSLALSVVFYSLWCVADSTVLLIGPNTIWTIPLVIAICMKYSLNVEGKSDGDPVNVLLSDKILLGFVLLFIAAFMILIYG